MTKYRCFFMDEDGRNFELILDDPDFRALRRNLWPQFVYAKGLPGTAHYPEDTTCVIRISHDHFPNPDERKAAEARAVEFFLEQRLYYSPSPMNERPGYRFTDFLVFRDPIEVVRRKLSAYFLHISPTGPWWIHVRDPYDPRDDADFGDGSLSPEAELRKAALDHKGRP